MIIPTDILLKAYPTFNRQNNTIRPTGDTCRLFEPYKKASCTDCVAYIKTSDSCGFFSNDNPELSYSLQLLYSKYPELVI